MPFTILCMFLLILPASNASIVTAEPLNFLRLTVVSSTTESPAQKYNGTKFFLDEWCKRLPKVRGLCFGWLHLTAYIMPTWTTWVSLAKQVILHTTSLFVASNPSQRCGYRTSPDVDVSLACNPKVWARLSVSSEVQGSTTGCRLTFQTAMDFRAFEFRGSSRWLSQADRIRLSSTACCTTSLWFSSVFCWSSTELPSHGKSPRSWTTSTTSATI